MTWWLRLFVVTLIGGIALGLPWWAWTVVPLVFLGLGYVRPPTPPERPPVEVPSPVRGRWQALNSPGSKVPSHGLRAYGQAYAMDMLHPRAPDASASIPWSGGRREPTEFACFGEPVLAVGDGTVVATSSGQRDHRSRESWPALLWMLVAEGFVRELGGVGFVLGNHVVVDHGDGTFAVYAHLQRGSVVPGVGDPVRAGDRLGLVGNSGNTTEPHLHLHLMDRAVPTAAAGVPFRWSDAEPPLPANDEVFVTSG